MPSKFIDEFLKKKEELKNKINELGDKKKSQESDKLDVEHKLRGEPNPREREGLEKKHRDIEGTLQQTSASLAGSESSLESLESERKRKQLESSLNPQEKAEYEDFSKQHRIVSEETKTVQLVQTPHDKSEYGQPLRPKAELQQEIPQQEQSDLTKEVAPNTKQPKLFENDAQFEKVALNRKESEIRGNSELDSGKKLNAVDEVLLAKKEVKEAANTVVNTMSQDQQEELRKQAGRGMRK